MKLISTNLNKVLLHERVTRTKDQVREHWFGYALLAPTLLGLLLVLWFPFVRGIWISFHNWPLLGDPEWAGLGNYTYLLTWGVFYTSLRATVVFGLSVVPQLIVALIGSLLVYRMDRFKSVVSGIFLLSYSLPAVVVGVIWRYMLNESFGPFFGYLVEFGILSDPIYWSISGDLSLIVITLASAWFYWPFMFLIISAALENIPEAHFEAARLYGANRINIFYKIIYPQIKSALLVAVSLRVIWNLSKVALPLTITGGGPGYETSVLGILLYRLAWSRGSLGQAYSLGIIMIIVSIFFGFFFIREYERESGEVGI